MIRITLLTVAVVCMVLNGAIAHMRMRRDPDASQRAAVLALICACIIIAAV